MSQTTVSLSPALKDHLRTVAGFDEKHYNPEYTVKEVDTLHEALTYIIDNPYEEQIEINGYEITLLNHATGQFVTTEKETEFEVLQAVSKMATLPSPVLQEQVNL